MILTHSTKRDIYFSLVNNSFKQKYGSTPSTDIVMGMLTLVVSKKTHFKAIFAIPCFGKYYNFW